MKQILIFILLITLSTFQLFACSCSTAWDDSFSNTAANSDFVALVKVVSFDEYLDYEISDSKDAMPYLMTVEVIKKYKGSELRKKIKIVGDNGIMCRHYLSNFKLNNLYLIAPNKIDSNKNTAYDLFVCETNFLEVDTLTNVALGNYSFFNKKIDLDDFEKEINSKFQTNYLIGLISLLFISIILYRKNKKRNANNG